LGGGGWGGGGGGVLWRGGTCTAVGGAEGCGMEKKRARLVSNRAAQHPICGTSRVGRAGFGLVCELDFTGPFGGCQSDIDVVW